MVTRVNGRIILMTMWTLTGAILAPPSETYGQERPSLEVGGLAEGSWGIARAAIPVYAGLAECGEFRNGTALNISGGIALAAREIVSGTDVVATLRVGSSRLRLTALPPVPTRIPSPDGETVLEMERSYVWEKTGSVAALDLLMRRDIGRRVWVGLGPAVEVSFGGTVRQTDNVTGPGRYRFSDGQPTRDMQPSTGTAPRSVAAAAVLELGREFTAGWSTVDPYLTMRADIGSRAGDGGIWSVRFGAGCRVLFDISKRRQTAPVEIAVDEAGSRAGGAHLSASLAMHAVDSNGHRHAVPTIAVFETVELLHTPLVPAVFFSAGSDSIAQRYLDGATAATVDPMVASQHSILDTVGSRLSARQSSVLALRGTAASDEAPSLAAQRQLAAARHLQQRWGVAEERLGSSDGRGALVRSSEATSDGRDDNRRVELTSPDPEILAPVVRRRVVRRYDPPSILLVPEIHSEAGIAEWSIRLFMGEREVAHFRSAGEYEQPVWNLVAGDSDSSSVELRAVLTVRDSSGGETMATARSPIHVALSVREIDAAVEASGEWERSRHRLVAFEFDRAEPGERSERELKSIARRIRPGARVRVTGSADRIGEDYHNQQLKQRRAESVAVRLRELLRELGTGEVAISTSLSPGESASARGMNPGDEFPEGRFLSRGVEVVIEQPR